MSSSRRRLLEHIALVEHAGRDGCDDDPDVSRPLGPGRARGQVERTDPGGRAAPGRQRRAEHGRPPRNRRLQPRAPGAAASGGAGPQDHRGDRPAPVDGRDGQAARERAAGGGAGGGLSQPGPLALPLDGDLGDGQLEKRREGARDRLAGPCPRLHGRRSPATTRPVCTSAAGRCRWRSRPGRPRCPRSRASRATSSSSPAPTRRKQAERAALNQLAGVDRRGDDPLLGFISRTTLSAYESSGRLEQLAQKKQSGPKYPNFGLARRLELIAQIIKADFGTRIFYTSLDGFDTHANQLGTHAALLNELSDSIAAFHDDLAAAGQGDRVALLTFSEFGRRVQENASQGTDHGAAAPVFLVGPVAKPGLVGSHPSLDDLDDGDLKYHTDFRSVYASLIADWLKLAAEPVVGSGFQGDAVVSSGLNPGKRMERIAQ